MRNATHHTIISSHNTGIEDALEALAVASERIAQVEAKLPLAAAALAAGSVSRVGKGLEA